MESSFGNWQAALEILLQTAKTNNDLIMFKNINNNYDRVRFILAKHYLNLVPWLPTYFANCQQMNRKSKKKSVYHRNAGNKMFQALKYADALESYNKSVIYAPMLSSELCLALGNRSAALLHLEKIQDCLVDVDRAISSQYPSEFCYKLHLRKAQCFAALKCIDDGLSELITADELLQKNIRHINRKTSDLAKQNITELRKKLSDSLTSLDVNVADQQSYSNPCIPKLSYVMNHQIPQASSAVMMMFTSKMGRSLMATQDIRPGDSLIVEQPFSAVLLPDFYDSHCNHCFSILTSPPLPCSECCRVRYCSEKCRKLAWDVYHHIECKYLDLLHSIGIAHLSLRTILIAGSGYLKEFLTSREDSLMKTNSVSGCYSPEVYEGNYLSIFNLVSHSDKIDVDDMFQYAMIYRWMWSGRDCQLLAGEIYFLQGGNVEELSTVKITTGGSPDSKTATLLLTVVVRSGWAAYSHSTEFPPTSSSLNFESFPGASTSRDFLLLGAALLLHIEQLVCNAHAITELQISQVSDMVDTESQVRIATAIYPTVSLMNHSCDPTVISSFHKDILVVRAVKSVTAGEEIFNCYGPHVKRMKCLERQKVLRDQYFFDCTCSACMQQNGQDRQFEALKCGKCDGMVVNTIDCFTCTDCDEVVNITDHNDRLKTASKLFTEGLAQLQQSQITGAIKQFRECQEIRCAVLYRHHKDLAEVEDCLAQCYAMIGEFDTAYEHLKRSVATTKLLHGENSIELAHELQKMAEILFNAKKVTLCLDTIDKALNIFHLNFGEFHSTINDLIRMKECLEKYSNHPSDNKSQMA